MSRGKIRGRTLEFWIFGKNLEKRGLGATLEVLEDVYLGLGLGLESE